jgi:DNA-binding GntR family transcriptional regulator
MTAEVPGYVSKTDLVAALIRELVITGELGPGEQLRQRDLAQRFGVSQTPVREAMRRLESEGLLICDTHRGFTVVEPEMGRVEENFQTAPRWSPWARPWPRTRSTPPAWPGCAS